MMETQQAQLVLVVAVAEMVLVALQVLQVKVIQAVQVQTLVVVEAEELVDQVETLTTDRGVLDYNPV
jgi:hypothetical protein